MTGSVSAVETLDVSCDGDSAPADVPYLRGELPLCETERGREHCPEQRLGSDHLCRREVGGQQREAPPGKREPHVGMESSSEELEVVRDHDEDAPGDERTDPWIDRDRADDTDGGRTGNRRSGESRKQRARDLRPQRSPVQLVEGMCSDADREEERDECRAKAGDGELGSERRADDDIAQMPGRVREMQDGQVVAPAARCERVERRSGDVKGWPRAHAEPESELVSRSRDPQMTAPPPRLMTRRSTSDRPASRQSSSTVSGG